MPRIHLILALLTAGLLTAAVAHQAAADPDAGPTLDAYDRAVALATGAGRWVPVPEPKGAA